MFDTAVATAGLTYAAAAETESTATAQALAAAGRGVCILSDDARYGLKSLPIRARGQDLIISVFEVWAPLPYASVRISDSLDELSAFIADLYPQASSGFTVKL